MKLQLALEFLKHVFVFGVEAKMIAPEEIGEQEVDEVTSIAQHAGFQPPPQRKEIGHEPDALSRPRRRARLHV